MRPCVPPTLHHPANPEWVKELPNVQTGDCVLSKQRKTKTDRTRQTNFRHSSGRRAECWSPSFQQPAWPQSGPEEPRLHDFSVEHRLQLVSSHPLHLPLHQQPRPLKRKTIVPCSSQPSASWPTNRARSWSISSTYKRADRDSPAPCRRKRRNGNHLDFDNAARLIDK